MKNSLYGPITSNMGGVTLVQPEYCVIQASLGRNEDGENTLSLTSLVNYKLAVLGSVWSQDWDSSLDHGYELGDLYKIRYVPSIAEWLCLDRVKAALNACNAVDVEAHYQEDGRESSTYWMYGYGTREDHGGTPAYKVLEDLLTNMMADLWDRKFAELIVYYLADSGENLKWCFDYARSTTGNMVLDEQYR